jgi:hypothetical protein
VEQFETNKELPIEFSGGDENPIKPEQLRIALGLMFFENAFGL